MAENYITVIGHFALHSEPRPHDLIEERALTRSGELRHIQYALKLSDAGV